MPDSKIITAPAKTALNGLVRANGPLVSLSVGVSEYSPISGFRNLGACSNDAERVRNALTDAPQLGADKARTRLLNAKTQEKPTKNTIIGQLTAMSRMASSEDRLFYFHSGHGIRLGEELYLVPSDAYAADDPDALLALSKIKGILNQSEARQKFIILDACYSGPNTREFKSVPAEVSNTFVKKYVAETVGVALLSSSGDEQMSTTQSPDPKVSLFTYFLLRALQGEPDALDVNKHLTLFSLASFVSSRVDRQARDYQHRQRAQLDTNTNGDFFFGDFGASPVELQGLTLDQHPIASLLFSEVGGGISIKSILTKMSTTSRYSEEYLEGVANRALPEYIKEDFGKIAASLARSLSISLAEISVEDRSIYFPDGELSVSYKADGHNRGNLHYEASFEGLWLREPQRLNAALLAMNMRPDEMTFRTNGHLNLDRMRTGLPVNGWTITSHLPDEVEASRDGYTLRATATELSLSGFTPKELFGDSADTNKSSLVSGVLALVATSPIRNVFRRNLPGNGPTVP